jgi:alginate O-acetyltransferase complex protein AlgI
VAGPIVRAADFIPQIYEKLKLSKAELSRALLLITGGLFKKAVISDFISINFVDRVFDNPLLYGSFENLIAVYGYAIQIYCDFSGYSDMAIGLSLLLGFRLPVNFDSPYQSSSVTEFWRRWHISLSSWLRDYLYIPLGGNRKGKARTYINLLLTMLIGGLWHGASWKFVVWGGLHGTMLALEKIWKSIVPSKNSLLLRWAGVLFTFHFVCFCWIFFRASSFENALEVIHQILKGFSAGEIVRVAQAYRNVIYMLAAGLVLHFIPKNIEDKYEQLFRKTPLLFKAVYLSVFIWIVIQVANAGVQPFIYFQF